MSVHAVWYMSLQARRYFKCVLAELGPWSSSVEPRRWQLASSRIRATTSGTSTVAELTLKGEKDHCSPKCLRQVGSDKSKQSWGLNRQLNRSIRLVAEQCIQTLAQIRPKIRNSSCSSCAGAFKNSRPSVSPFSFHFSMPEIRKAKFGRVYSVV